MTDPLDYMPVQEIPEAIRQRRASAAEVVDAYLARASAARDEFNCYLAIAERHARDAAKTIDALPEDEKARLPLLGVPVALKDNIATQGIETTAGSPIMRGWHPTEDAPLVATLRAAGAVILGKLNLWQFALRSAHPDFGEVRNPWDPRKGCAGSSSGAGAAVACGAAPIAFGTDTAGSLRLPAAVCGVTGFKPTYGLLPTDGILPASPLLDHVGPLTRTAAEARSVFDALISTGQGSSADDVPHIRNFRIGVPLPQSDSYIDPAMAAAVEAAVATLERAGAIIVEVDLPAYTAVSWIVHTLAAPEIADVHRRAVSREPRAYSPDVRQQILTGSLIPAPLYIQARRMQGTLTRRFDAIFERVDAIACPVIPMPAWDIDDNARVEIDGEQYDALAAMTLYCPPANLAGLPAISLPAGFNADGLPLAFQLIGPRLQDRKLLNIARLYQSQTDWHTRRPNAHV